VHLYKVTTAGTCAAAQSTLYPGVAGEVIQDGTAYLTEQDVNLDAGTACVEPTWTGYGRIAVSSALANWAGTQGAGTTVTSSGTGSSGTTSNNSAINFSSPSAGSGPWYCWGVAEYDLASAGHLLYWGPMSATKTINVGDAAPSIAAGQWQITES
jgi:hypothetical protein